MHKADEHNSHTMGGEQAVHQACTENENQADRTTKASMVQTSNSNRPTIYLHWGMSKDAMHALCMPINSCHQSCSLTPNLATHASMI